MIGIVFTGGEAPCPERCRELAANADVIAAADSGLVVCENAGIVPDIIAGDMDSLDDTRRLEKYPAAAIFRFPHDKDNTDTEIAIDLLWQRGCDCIAIAGGGGGRIDHIFALLAIFEREKSPALWITARETMFKLTKDFPFPPPEFIPAAFLPSAFLPRNCAPQNIVSLFPLGKGPWKAASNGLKWPLDTVIWDRGICGVSNETTGAPLRIEATTGSFLAVFG
jgi:thiamine pyrophosphokinase